MAEREWTAEEVEAMEVAAKLCESFGHATGSSAYERAARHCADLIRGEYKRRAPSVAARIGSLEAGLALEKAERAYEHRRVEHLRGIIKACYEAILSHGCTCACDCRGKGHREDCVVCLTCKIERIIVDSRMPDWSKGAGG